jgi:hypothetical protein
MNKWAITGIVSTLLGGTVLTDSNRRVPLVHNTQFSQDTTPEERTSKNIAKLELIAGPEMLALGLASAFKARQSMSPSRSYVRNR